MKPLRAADARSPGELRSRLNHTLDHERRGDRVITAGAAARAFTDLYPRANLARRPLATICSFPDLGATHGAMT
jgi:hypothetical protein